MMVLVILLGVLVVILGMVAFLQNNTIELLTSLRKLENDRYAEELMADAERIKELKQQLEAAQNAYLTLGRYILENKDKLNEQD